MNWQDLRQVKTDSDGSDLWMDDSDWQGDLDDDVAVDAFDFDASAYGGVSHRENAEAYRRPRRRLEELEEGQGRRKRGRKYRREARGRGMSGHRYA